MGDILLYHVIGGYRLTTDFRERPYETLNGQPIRWNELRGRTNRRRMGSSDSYDWDCDHGHDGDGDHGHDGGDGGDGGSGGSGGSTDGFKVEGYQVIDIFGDVNEVIVGNLRATNGVVHEIDGVLLPTGWNDFSQPGEPAPAE